MSNPIHLKIGKFILKYSKHVYVCVWAWAQWGRNSASSLWGRSMCPASTTVVLGHRCHLLQQPASHHSPSPTTHPLVNSSTPKANTRNLKFWQLYGFYHIWQKKKFKRGSQSDHKSSQLSLRLNKRKAIWSYGLCYFAMTLPRTDSATYTELSTAGW